MNTHTHKLCVCASVCAYVISQTGHAIRSKFQILVCLGIYMCESKSLGKLGAVCKVCVPEQNFNIYVYM